MTPAALKSAVLKKLEVTAAGDSDAADDIAIITQKYVSLHKLLLVDGLVTWSITEAIPEEAAQAIIMMLAFSAANEFGVPELRYNRLAREGALNMPEVVGGPSVAERQLRKALAPKYVSSAVVSEYF